MRVLLTLVILLLAASCFSSDILIFLKESEAGPVLHEGMLQHPTWVLWPKASDASQSNRFLSLSSGVDWQGSVDQTLRAGSIAALISHREEWEKRGLFRATRHNLGARHVLALTDSERLPPPVLLSAWVQPPRIATVGRAEKWDPDALVVAMVTATNPWDETAALVRKAGGRALIVEIPISAETRWTRIWLQGREWPDGVPTIQSTRIRGLVPARNLMSMLSEPGSAQWLPPPSDPPNAWLNYGHNVSPVALVFLAVGAVYIFGLGVYYAQRESYSRVASFLLRLTIVSPAAIILGGRLTSLTEVSAWILWHFVALLIVGLAAFILNRIVSRWMPDCHPLWGEFVAGLVVVAGIDPAWSFFSHVLGPHRAPVSPEAFGAFACYAIGAGYLFGSQKTIRFIWGLLCLSIVTDLLIVARWIGPMLMGSAVLVLVAFGRPFVEKLRWVLVAMIAMGLFSAVVFPGLAYAPDHLVHTYEQFGKYNCAEQISFVMSPMFTGFAVIGITAAITGDSFLGHQIRRAMAFSPQPRSMLAAAVCFAVAGVFIPLFLHAALATAILGGIAVLFDAIRVP